jgi:hypothetical protein
VILIKKKYTYGQRNGCKKREKETKKRQEDKEVAKRG